MTNRNITVLAVDDDPGDVEILRRTLEGMEGYEVTLRVSSNLDHAKEALASGPVDAIFLDFRLGANNGLDFVNELRKSGNLLPVIAWTGQGDQYTAAALIQAGADDYLSKDVMNPVALRRSIEHATDRYHRRRLEKHNLELLGQLPTKNEELASQNRRLAELYDTAHQFVDNVSHEFRTPLTVIKEFTSIVLDELAGPITAEQREYLTTVLNRVDDLATMIDDMLDISKLEAGLLGVARQATRVEEILSRVTSTLQRKAQASGVSIRFEVSDDLPILYCDGEKIARVLTNLGINAVKFSPEGGLVRIEAVREDDHGQVRFNVIDQGPGIDAKFLSIVFDRFQQADTSVRCSTKGFGLGLNIARELIHLNLGDIDVSSAAGQGSTFTFTVPTMDPHRLIHRYLQRVERFRGGGVYVSLVEINVESAADPTLLEEVESFLQHHIRHSDLLIGREDAQWMLVAASNLGDVTNLVHHIQESLHEANENRPGRRLPLLSFSALGSWNLRSDQAGLVGAFEAWHGVLESAHA